MEQFKNKVNSNENKNTRFVIIKEDRKCATCGEVLEAGNVYITTNNRGEGRRWYCNVCLSNMIAENYTNRQCDLYKSIIATRANLNNVAFGDEGASIAYMDALSEYESKCLDCNNCAFAKTIKTIK